jgi:hypothetical protein
VELEQASALAGRAPRFAHLEAAAGVGASPAAASAEAAAEEGGGVEEGERECGAARRVGPWGWAAVAVGLQYPQDCATGEGLLHFAAGGALAAGAPTVAALCAFWRCSMGCTSRWRRSKQSKASGHGGK